MLRASAGRFTQSDVRFGFFGYLSTGHAPAFDWAVATPWWMSTFVPNREAELGLALMFASMIPIYWRAGQEQIIDLLRCHFGLTPAEARLALHLVTGETLRSAAIKLNISYETARTSLKSIFKKTGTCRQPELVIVIITAHPDCPEPPEAWLKEANLWREQTNPRTRPERLRAELEALAVQPHRTGASFLSPLRSKGMSLAKWKRSVPSF